MSHYRDKGDSDRVNNLSGLGFSGLSSFGGLGALWTSSDHLQCRHDLLLELIPLDDGVVELDLRKVNEHASDLWSPLLTDQLLDVLVDGVANDLFLLGSVSSLLVLGTGKHVSDLQEVLVSVAGLDQLWR